MNEETHEAAKATGVGPQILDLDALAPRSRFVDLAGKRFDVTEISIENMILLADFQSIAKEMTGGEGMKGLTDLMAKLLGESAEWIAQHMTLAKMKAVAEFVVESAEAALDEEDDEGNASAAGP